MYVKRQLTKKFLWYFGTTVSTVEIEKFLQRLDLNCCQLIRNSNSKLSERQVASLLASAFYQSWCSTGLFTYVIQHTLNVIYGPRFLCPEKYILEQNIWQREAASHLVLWFLVGQSFSTKFWALTWAWIPLGALRHATFIMFAAFLSTCQYS